MRAVLRYPLMMVVGASEEQFSQMELLLINILMGVVVGMALGYFWYRRGLRERRPTSQSWARTIVEDTLPLPKGLEVAFEGKSIPRLTETHLFFWNAGKETIKASDVTEAIRFRFDDQTEVVQARVVKVSRKANRFQAHITLTEASSVTCSFEYVDRKDGGAIKVLHTGSFPYPSVAGEIQGVPKGIIELEPYGHEGFFGGNLRRVADLGASGHQKLHGDGH